MIETLDVGTINSFLDELNRNLIFLYSLVMLVSVGRFKVINSLTLSAMIAMAVHGMNLAFIDILMPYIDELVIAPLNPEKVKIANYIWYPFWSTFYVFAIYSVHYIHKMLNISDTGVSKMLSASYLALLCLQAVGYFDALYFYSDELALVYHFGVPAVNIGLGFYLFLRLKDRKETYDAVNRPVDG